jgi:hypothetical protein
MHDGAMYRYEHGVAGAIAAQRIGAGGQVALTEGLQAAIETDTRHRLAKGSGT